MASLACGMVMKSTVPTMPAVSSQLSSAMASACVVSKEKPAGKFPGVSRFTCGTVFLNEEYSHSENRIFGPENLVLEIRIFDRIFEFGFAFHTLKDRIGKNKPSTFIDRKYGVFDQYSILPSFFLQKRSRENFFVVFFLVYEIGVCIRYSKFDFLTILKKQNPNIRKPNI